ncbi:MAG TPA: class I SAM-dependent methyltransferase [Bacteroidia bacterium]|nr:class I SAM-dependent methyltransferase [Bacteroidia bacterium]
MKRNYPYHYDIATGLYARLANQSYWQNSISDLINFMGRVEGNMILDAGCGHGMSTQMLAAAFPHASIKGVDISKNMIRRALRAHSKSVNESGNLEFICADAAGMPFQNETFDVVTAHSFLYMVHSREKIIKEFFRVLKPGGMVVLLEPGTSIDAIGRSAILKDNFSNRKPKTPIRTKMLLLRIYSTRKGMVTPKEMETLFSKSGFTDYTWKETQSKRGLLVKAIKP